VRAQEERARPVATSRAGVPLAAFAAGSLFTAAFLWLFPGHPASTTPAADAEAASAAPRSAQIELPSPQPAQVKVSSPVPHATVPAPLQQATLSAPVQVAPAIAPPAPKQIVEVPVPIQPALAPPAPRPVAKAPAVPAARPHPPQAAAPPAAARAAAFLGRLLVDSDPAGARVTLNGKAVGTTPLRLADMPIGSKAIRVDMDGHQAWSSVVRIVANQETRVNAGRLPRVDSDSAPP